MGLFGSSKEKVFCAFCRTPHSVFKDKSFQLRHMFLSFLTSVCISFLIWKEYNPKSLMFFVAALMLSEVFLRLRWRLHIACRACGFDAITYAKDPALAAETVKNFLMQRKNDPQYLLKKPLNLPTRKPTQDPSLLGKSTEHSSKSLSTRI
jgi:hypothetical protein